MTGPIEDRLQQSIEAASGLYHRLVLLVGKTGTGKTAVLHRMAAHRAVPLVNLNLVLSAQLLELTAKQRALRLPRILEQLLDEALEQTMNPSQIQPLIILDNLELLFDPQLRQDPLRLLQGLSRNRRILASWNGRFQAGRLDYAAPDHPEYRCYDSVDALVVGIDGWATIDADN
ncbi:MAG: BREX-3 system P-loop-containing protein BrxF [Lamprobacter sp.]|uniref:BREX-3 system P-loop-containing protein BrxF n=1 Tax=Lamprobacter sp. TaxID=3100796 RepID=UPI002B25ED74|nr:BREX-3 system P-loop-containing protein BrxF [Lamprobacter sp.]MEA3639188.1 BREX-3 system P-loop-containing protein BrxF [Lamprobacter sp.]